MGCIRHRTNEGKGTAAALPCALASSSFVGAENKNENQKSAKAVKTKCRARAQARSMQRNAKQALPSAKHASATISGQKAKLLFRVSIVASIAACHADGPGSIPGRGDEVF